MIDTSAVYSVRGLWWHTAILRELARLRDECGTDGYTPEGLAGNLRGFTVMDTEKYVAQMLAWGELETCEPLWDFPATWVRLPSVTA